MSTEQTAVKPQIDFSRFFQQEDIGNRKAAPNFNKNLQKEIDAKTFDKLEIVHDKPHLDERGHYVQDIVGFHGSKGGEGHSLFLHFTQEEEKEYRETLKAMLKQHIKERKEERT